MSFMIYKEICIYQVWDIKMEAGKMNPKVIPQVLALLQISCMI